MPSASEMIAESIAAVRSGHVSMAPVGPDITELLALIPENVWDEPASWREVDALVPDVLDVAAVSAHTGVARSEAAILLSRVAALPLALGRYGDAVALSRWAASLLDAEPEPDPRAVPEVNASLATALALDGKGREALRRAKRALKESLLLHGEMHRDTALSMGVLAFVLNTRMRYLKALRLLKRALKIARHTLDEEDPHVQTMYGNLAATYRSLGMTRRARRMHEETFELRRHLYGPDHPKTLVAMHNLGISLAESTFGRRRGIEMLEQAAALRIRTLGEEHPLTQLTVEVLAMVGSRPKLGAANHTAEPSYPDPRTTRTMLELASELDGAGDLAGARRLLESALASERRARGPRHWRSRRTARWLLALLLRQRDPRGAVRAVAAALGF